MDRPAGSESKAWGWNLPLGSDFDRIAGVRKTRTICRRVLAGIRAGGFSSIHRHDFQANAFFLLKGRMLLTEYEQDVYGKPVLEREHVLLPGDSVMVPARRLHKFLSLADCRLLEVYVACGGCDASADDIVRFTDNGCDESLTLQHV